MLNWAWQVCEQRLSGGTEPRREAGSLRGAAVLIQLVQPPKGPISQVGLSPTGEMEDGTRGGTG